MSDHLPQERVLLLLPTQKDCTLSREILHQVGIDAHPCTSMGELCEEAAKGAGAVILTEEAILGNGRELLGSMLRAQPDWSDLPLIVLTAAGAESAERTRALLNLGHMTLMKRPVEVSTLVTAVQAALRDRRRQYLIRDHIDQIARQAEALRASENRYRALADNVQQLFWTCTAEGLCDYLSAQWVDYTGIPEAQQLGMGWLSLVIHPDDRERTRSRWEAAARGQASYDLEYRIKAADGTYRWFKARGTPIRDQQGRIVRWFGTCTDIEDQKQAEAALQAADRKKNEFLAMLAHELRNPLASVGTAVQLLEFPNAQAEIPWVHDVIARQVKQFGRLIDDLLDVSRITRGTIELRTETLDAARVLERAQESVRPIVDERGHQLFVSLAAEPLWMMADPTRLEQIVVNLLTNAAKYTPANGKIWLTACREEDSIVIRVRDNGIGIPPEKLPEMFELFTQGDRSLARSEGGLGVGLTLVKSLVELHGGSVVAKSGGPGQGTEFILRFPATEPQPHPALDSASAPASGPDSAVRVLIVDDNQDTAWSLAKLLSLLGHDVRTAHDGPSAIAQAREQKPRYIVLDIGLPGKDGYEVASEIRKEQFGKEAILIAVTGYGQSTDRLRAHEAGFDHYLVKPIDHDELLNLLVEA